MTHCTLFATLAVCLAALVAYASLLNQIWH